MTLLATASALLLAVTLAGAGLGKLRNLPAARTTARQLGVPPLLTGPVVVATIVTELAAAAFLLVPGLLSLGAALAVALLAAFTIASTLALARGRRPTCACFGQRNPTPIGASVLTRNIVLLLAGVIALSPAAPTFWWTGMRGVPAVALILGGCAVAAVGAWAWITVELLRQQGRLLLRIEALERHLLPRRADSDFLPLRRAEPRPLPDAVVRDNTGRRWSLPDLHTAGEPLLLLFTDADCATCRRLLPGVVAADQSGSLGLSLAILSRQPVHYPGAQCFTDEDGDAASQLGITGVPSAAFVDANGLLPYEIAAGPRAISALLRTGRTPGTSERPGATALADPFAAPVATP